MNHHQDAKQCGYPVLDMDNPGAMTRAARVSAQSVNAAYDALKAKPVSPLDAALGRLDAATDEMRTIISGITERLQPVLTPSGKGVSDTGSPNAETSLPAPLVDGINRQTNRVQATLSALRELERRLVM